MAKPGTDLVNKKKKLLHSLDCSKKINHPNRSSDG
jgi:hypothetical protein